MAIGNFQKLLESSERQKVVTVDTAPDCGFLDEQKISQDASREEIVEEEGIDTVHGNLEHLSTDDEFSLGVNLIRY